MSLRALLSNGKEMQAKVIRLLRSVLTGISRYTVDGQESQLNAFRDSMLAVAEQINEHSTSEDLETSVEYAMDLLRDYNNATQKTNNAQSGELKAVMRTMTDTITFLSESRTRSVHQLQIMQRELEQASELEDIRLLRTRLVKCLEVVQDETARLQTESESRSEEVRQQIDRANKIMEPPPRFGSMDNVTGLPSRRVAEKAITDTIAEGEESAIALFVINRLPSINARYGRSVGDEVVLRVANHFAQRLSTSAFLYRWSGPALLALMPLSGKADEVKRNWSKWAAVKHELTLESNQNPIFAVVETGMWFQTINRISNAGDVFQDLDKYVAGQAGGE